MKQALIATLTALIILAAGEAPILADEPHTARAVETHTPTKHAKPIVRHRRRSSGTPPGVLPGPDRSGSQRAVCQSQCNLQRMACDQGRSSAYQNRADQLQAAQASCMLAVQGCLARC